MASRNRKRTQLPKCSAVWGDASGVPEIVITAMEEPRLSSARAASGGELMKYCSALTSMQALEAEHHYLALRVRAPERPCQQASVHSCADASAMTCCSPLSATLEQMHRATAEIGVRWETRNATRRAMAHDTHAYAC